MKSQSLIIGLVLAAAFLVTTNVQAAILTSKPTAEGGKEIVSMDSYTVSYVDGQYVSSNGNLQRNEAADFVIEDWVMNIGWSFSVAAPKDYDYFTLSRGVSAGNSEPMNLTINNNPYLHFGEHNFDSWWWTANMQDVLFDDRSTIYFNDAADANGTLQFDFLTTPVEQFATTDGSPDFVLTFYRQQSKGTPTPEPTTLAVLGLGLAGLGMVSRRRRK